MFAVVWAIVVMLVFYGMVYLILHWNNDHDNRNDYVKQLIKLRDKQKREEKEK